MDYKKGRKMDVEDIASMVSVEYDNAKGLLQEIQSDRIRALKYYDQEPFGNEEEGLSKYVSSDVRDAIEWTMPQLVDIFVGGDAPVVFNPINAEDVEQARIETEYCRNVFTNQNKGVIISTSWFKDALLQKNGIVKAYWEERETCEREEYKGKSAQEYAALQTDEEFEIEEVSIFLNDVEYTEDEFKIVLETFKNDPEAMLKYTNEALFDIVGHRKGKIGQVRIKNVPPENFFVQREHDSIFLNEADYCCERYDVMRSSLVADGYDRELVKDLPCGQLMGSAALDETTQRFKKEGGALVAQDNTSMDDSRDIIVIYDHYIRADYNGDGIAELMFVRTVGKSAEYVLECEECDRIPYHAITPYVNSHKFYGRSIADNLFDIARSKSQLMRDAFDNILYSAKPRKVVTGDVNITDLMTYIPGGVIRVKNGGSVGNDVTPFVADSALAMVDRLDGIRAERTGYSRDSAGLNPAALANSTDMIGMAIMQQSQLLVKMMATVIAHSGFSDLMLHIRELLLKYEDKKVIFDVAGNFVPVDPRSWRKNRSTDVKVGVGFAGKMEEMSAMKGLLDLQERLVSAQGGISGPLTNPEGIHNTIKRLCNRMGIKDVTTYFPDPADYTPPPPSPSLADIQMKAAIDKMNSDIKISEGETALKKYEIDKDYELEAAKISQQERMHNDEIESKEKIAILELSYRYGKDASDRAMAIFKSKPDQEIEQEEDDMEEKDEENKSTDEKKESEGE